MTEETKVCVICNEDKVLTKFLFKYDSKTGKSTGERRELCRDCRNKKTSPEVPKVRTLRDRVGELEGKGGHEECKYTEAEKELIFEDMSMYHGEIVSLKEKVSILEDTVKNLSSMIDEIRKASGGKSEAKR